MNRASRVKDQRLVAFTHLKTSCDTSERNVYKCDLISFVLFYDAISILEYTEPMVGSVASGMIQGGFSNKTLWSDQKAIPTSSGGKENNHRKPSVRLACAPPV